jgi:hypothetical protein
MTTERQQASFSGPIGMKAKGSREWCWQITDKLKLYWKDKQLTDKEFQQVVDEVLEHRPWEKIPPESPYGSFEAMCQAELGVTPDAVQAEIDRRRQAVANPRPDGREDNRRGGKGLDESCPGGTNQATDRQAKRVRSIARAPDAIHDLYARGLIGAKVAEKLGPKNPAPELAAKVAEAAQVATATAKTHEGKSPRIIQAEVNKASRAALGLHPDPVRGVLRAYNKLTIEQRARFHAALAAQESK